LLLITNRKSHRPKSFKIARTPSILDDLDGLLRTLLCQYYGIVAKRHAVRVNDSTVGYGDDEFLSAVNSIRVLSAAVWLQFLNAKLLPEFSEAIAYVRQITAFYLSVDCSVHYSSVTLACMGLQSL